MSSQSEQHWSKRACQHYAQGEGVLSDDELKHYQQELGNEWNITRFEKKTVLHRQFLFKRYQEVLAFVASVGKIAEEQNHHPDMLVKWGQCDLYFQTHSAGGITLNDLICAHLIEKIA